MNDDVRRRLLGDDTPDPGCDAAFAELDRYAEAVLQGRVVGSEFAAFLNHLEHCPACREDTEGFLAVLRQLDSPPEP